MNSKEYKEKIDSYNITKDKISNDINKLTFDELGEMSDMYKQEVVNFNMLGNKVGEIISLLEREKENRRQLERKND